MIISAQNGHFCREHNQRLYLSLITDKPPLTPDLEAYWARDRALRPKILETTTKEDERAAQEVDTTIEQIFTSESVNVTDLATMANACAAANSELWRDSIEDLSWEEEVVRRLVEAVLAVAGEKLILDGLPLPSPIEQGAFSRAIHDEPMGLA